MKPHEPRHVIRTVKREDVQRLLAPKACPICGGELAVSELLCTDCGTVLRNMFIPDDVAQFGKEELEFLGAFLRHRGDLQAAADELHLGPAAAARRLDELIEKLSARNEAAPRYDEHPHLDVGRRAILDRLDRGEITAEEATRLLEEMGRGRSSGT